VRERAIDQRKDTVHVYDDMSCPMSVSAGDGIVELQRCSVSVVGDCGSSTQDAVHLRHYRRRHVAAALHVAVLEVAVRRVDDSHDRPTCTTNTHTHTHTHLLPFNQSMKKRSEETQTLCAGCSKAEPKISPLRRPPSRGHGTGPKFNQLEMVTTFTCKPGLARIDARNFELSW